jgi:hypothetical protein
MPPVERALRELEAATDAAAAMILDDPAGAGAILKRRAKAITQVAGLRESVLALPATAREAFLQRLRSAFEGGEWAKQKVARARRRAMADWSRWNQVHRALDPARRGPARNVDYCG